MFTPQENMVLNRRALLTASSLRHTQLAVYTVNEGKNEMNTKTSVLITLSCDHLRLIKVNAAMSSIWCAKCNAAKELKAVNLKEWHVKCGHCSYARWVGFSSITANQIANAHCRQTEHVNISVTLDVNDNAVKLRDRLVKIGILREV